MIYLLTAINVILFVSGQVAWKIGLGKIGNIRADNISSVISSPYILFGLALYVIATGFWFIILSRADLSIVYPLQSLAYVVALFASLIIFKENIPAIRWAGVSVIVFGVYLTSIR